jgi:hypothetical protein
MNDREFSDIEIFQNSRKGIPLFMAGHKNCLQADYSYLLGPGPRSIKKRIYRAAVSQSLRNTVLHERLTYAFEYAYFGLKTLSNGLLHLKRNDFLSICIHHPRPRDCHLCF